MANKGLIAGGVIAAVIAGGVGIALVSQAKVVSPPTPPPVSVASINLSANNTNISTGNSVIFTATALDSQSNPVSGVSLTLFDVSTSTSVSMGSTNSSGVATVSVTFNTSGTYVLEAES